MNKSAIKNFAVWARNKLIKDITLKAGLLGVNQKGILSPLPESRDDYQLFDIGTKEPSVVEGLAVRQRESLVKAIQDKAADSDYATAFEFIIEEVAYTWFNRLIAIRFMEINDYLPARVRVLSSEQEGKLEPDFVTTPFDTDLDFTDAESDLIYRYKDENKLDELFRLLFIKQCNKLHEILPRLFEKTADYTELLLNISFSDKDGIVYHLTHDISGADFNIQESGQVEIIGWLYQYYNTEPKDKTSALLKKNVKVTKERIPAATQLFTPDWIVRYMVENSLGRLWVEGHPNEELKAGWKYYLEEAEQKASVQAQLDEIRQEYAALSPEELKVIDPCCGSGHILVYAFDVLEQIYESQGYSVRDIPRLILENNLYGLDIDERAAQLAYFALMMKARQYDRRFFNRGVEPQVYSPKGYKEGEEYGSLLTVEELEEKPDIDNWDIFEGDFEQAEKIWNFRHLLAQKYHVVVTNPPYMGGSNMNPNLNEFIKKNYPDYKSDFFSAFVVRCSQMAKPTGKLGFFTPYVWMFIQSYEKMRQFLYSKTIETLIQFEYSAFEEATVPVCTFAFSNSHVNKKGCYLRLTEFRGGMEVQRQKTLEAITDHDCGYYYEQSTDNFSKIPGSPVGYWANHIIFNLFDEMRNMTDVADIRHGMSTSDNNRFLRLWHEVKKDTINFNAKSKNDTYDRKWFPILKGGEFRKWYGNLEYVVNWKNNGEEIKAVSNQKYPYLKGNLDFVLGGQKQFFKKGITWSSISSGTAGFRYYPEGFMFTNKGQALFCYNDSEMQYYLGYLNSKVVKYLLEILAPTIGFEMGYIGKLPALVKEHIFNHASEIVNECIISEKIDWDSFETSWDFQHHPLIPTSQMKSEWQESQFVKSRMEKLGSLQWHYEQWKQECEERFAQLKANEEELNRIFIDIYGLQDELTPEVEDKDITVRRADLKRDVKSLISYAVGCMFGRYSPYKPGLIYAGGDWDEAYGDFPIEKVRLNPDIMHGTAFYTFGTPITAKGKVYLKDVDQMEDSKLFWGVDDGNCIPITDEAYFEDDIVAQFVKFLEVVYGEETLEENLNFVANALGNKGDTSREVIRNYFLTDFFKDHCKIYQKRPIYWLFDAGKQNGFKALVYMHRWNADTVGNLRVEYLHKTQHIYEREIQRMQETIDNAGNSREVSRAAKRKTKLQKQLKETKDYDARLAHIALSRIEIDLDDGVKVNYEKVQTDRDGKKMQILAKI